MSSQERQTVLLYQFYMVVSEPLFWGPILIFSLQNLAHMTLSSIFFMEAIVMMVLVVCTVPAGALADTIGKKRAVLLGRVFLVVSIACFASMTSPLLAWVGNLAWAFGFALTSGSESSLLYETLKRSGAEKKFRRIQGHAISYRFWVAAISCLLVGVLVAVHPRLPLYLSVIGQVAALLLVIPMHEPGRAESFSLQTQLVTLRHGIRFVLKTPVVLWMILFAALIGLISKIWFFTYNPYFELVGVPVAHFGIIFFLLNVVAAISSKYAHTIDVYIGELGLIVFAIACLALPILVMSLFPVYAMAYIVVAQNIVRGFIRPFTEDFVHHHISGEEAESARATIMSVKSAISQVIVVLGLLVISVALNHLVLTAVLFALGIFTVVAGIVVVLSYLVVVKPDYKTA